MFGKEPLVNFVVCSDRLQQNRLGAFVRYKLEDNPQIVSGATSP